MLADHLQELPVKIRSTPRVTARHASLPRAALRLHFSQLRQQFGTLREVTPGDRNCTGKRLIIPRSRVRVPPGPQPDALSNTGVGRCFVRHRVAPGRDLKIGTSRVPSILIFGDVGLDDRLALAGRAVGEHCREVVPEALDCLWAGRGRWGLCQFVEFVAAGVANLTSCGTPAAAHRSASAHQESAGRYRRRSISACPAGLA
jgi:hypothetical protein